MISQIFVLLSIAQKLCSAFKGRSRCGIETYSWHVVKNNLVSPDKFIYAIFKRSDAVKSSCTPLSSPHSTKCIRCSAETFAMATFVCFCIHCPLGTCVNVQEGEAMEFIVGNYMWRWKSTIFIFLFCWCPMKCFFSKLLRFVVTIPLDTVTATSLVPTCDFCLIYLFFVLNTEMVL